MYVHDLLFKNILYIIAGIAAVWRLPLGLSVYLRLLSELAGFSPFPPGLANNLFSKQKFLHY